MQLHILQFLVMSSDSENDYLNLNFIKNFITEEQHRLEEDKLRLERNQDVKSFTSDENRRVPFQNNASQNITVQKPLNNIEISDNRLKKQSVEKHQRTTYMIRNSREEEINKFIEKISKPRESVKENKQTCRSYLEDTTNRQFNRPVVNIREKEKDQLSEIFASSQSPFSNLSSRHIGKNLYSSLSFNEKQCNLEKVCDENDVKSDIKSNNYLNGFENRTLEEEEDYLRAKYNHPRIVISQSPEGGSHKGDKMVRIGEFSPLNPNLPGGAAVLGLGDWDERRQILLQKYRQVSRSPSPSPSDYDYNRRVRSVAVQTEIADETPRISVERSPQRTCQRMEMSHSNGCSDLDKTRASPIPKCFENLTEKEIKEIIYRQELQKQIEEKNRLKEEMKKKELEEEAKIEAKIQRDLERMRRQYEEERLHRLELAIKRREQEDLLIQKLAVEQQKVTQESKTKRRSVRNSVSPVCKQLEKSTQSDFKKSSKSKVPYSQSLPERSAASTLSCVQRELRQPLLQPSNGLYSIEGLVNDVPDDGSKNISPTRKTPTNRSISPPISTQRSKEVDILARKAVFNTSSKTGSWTNRSNSFNARDKLKEVDDILKQPLLTESHVLPPVSQPLLHATIPPLTSSLSPSRGNIDLLEDKWKVSHTEHDSAKHDRVLTQLGTFRRQLQQESLRMRQRVKDDST